MKKVVYLILISVLITCSSVEKDKASSQEKERTYTEMNQDECVEKEAAKNNEPIYDLSDPDSTRHDINMVDLYSDKKQYKTELEYIKERRKKVEKQAKESEASYKKTLEEERRSTQETRY